MGEETFIRLQHSEGVVCHMASRLLAAFISSGQLTPENEDVLVDRSIRMAVKLAFRTDRAIESDDENGDQ